MDEPDDEAVPGAIVEAYLERADAVETLLAELQTMALEGRHAEIHDRVRAIAEADEAVFFTVAFSLADSAQFFGDVEAQLDVTAADRLRDLAAEYGDLDEYFGVVRREIAEDRQTPVTDLRYTVRYHRGIESPMVSYEPLSGRESLFESTGTPAEVVALAADLVAATEDALEVALAEDYSLNTDELGSLIDEQERLSAEVTELDDTVDQVRRTPVDE